MRGEQREPTVQVTFTETGECLEAAVRKSFQAFVRRELHDSVDLLTERL